MGDDMQIYVCVTIFVTERHTPFTTNREREEQEEEERYDATLREFMRGLTKHVLCSLDETLMLW